MSFQLLLSSTLTRGRHIGFLTCRCPDKYAEYMRNDNFRFQIKTNTRVHVINIEKISQTRAFLSIDWSN
jgi:hypothetical protein